VPLASIEQLFFLEKNEKSAIFSVNCRETSVNYLVLTLEDGPCVFGVIFPNSMPTAETHLSYHTRILFMCFRDLAWTSC
jgi:hypothetical protein